MAIELKGLAGILECSADLEIRSGNNLDQTRPGMLLFLILSTAVPVNECSWPGSKGMSEFKGPTTFSGDIVQRQEALPTAHAGFSNIQRCLVGSREAGGSMCTRTCTSSPMTLLFSILAHWPMDEPQPMMLSAIRA